MNITANQIKVLAILCITGLATACIVTDTDHGILYFCITAVAGLAGYAIGKRNSKS